MKELYINLYCGCSHLLGTVTYGTETTTMLLSLSGDYQMIISKWRITSKGLQRQQWLMYAYLHTHDKHTNNADIHMSTTVGTVPAHVYV